MSNIYSLYDPYNDPTSVVPGSGAILNSSSMSVAPSGYGSDYDKLFASNPYRNLNYKKSFWQNFASALGFRTDADRFLEDAQVNAAEYDAGIFSMMQQNQFNSPAAQASRMRDAGLNPDLLGTGDVAAAASPTEDPNGMSQNVGDEFSDFGNTVASVFSRAMTIFKDFKSLEQMNTIIDSQNIDNAVKMNESIDSFILNTLTSEDMVSYDTYKERLYGMRSNGFPSDYARNLGFSKRQMSQFNRLFQDKLLSMSTDEKAYNQFKERVLAMSGSKEAETNPFAFGTKGFADVTNESAVDIMVKGLYRAHKLSLKYTANANAARSAVENQEAQTLEDMNAGVASARSQFNEYNSKKAVAQWNADCARIKKDMLRHLERSALSGDWLAKAMLMSWSLDDIARMNVGLNASANFGLNLGFGANLSNSVSTLFTP